MTDSVTRKPEENTNEAIQKRLEKYETKPIKERTDVSDLPTWVKLALIKREALGLTWNDAAKDFNRKGSTLAKYGRAPAAQEIREKLREWRESVDPIEAAKAFMASNAFHISLDRFLALEWAKDAKDAALVDRIASDLQDRIGITKKKTQEQGGSMSITVNLAGGGSFEAPSISVSHEEVEEAEYEMLEEGG